MAAARLTDLGRRHAQSSGRRERIAYLGANECAAAVSVWIAVRGTEDGPFFRPVNKGGRGTQPREAHGLDLAR